jgi:cellulose synthase operon protein C
MARIRLLACLPLVLILAASRTPSATAWGAVSAAPTRADEGDEQYQFLAGLCDKGLWDLAAREGRTFLERFPRHGRSELARYRLATALFELGRRDEAAKEFATLARRAEFEFAAEVAFRLGQCALEAGNSAVAVGAFENARNHSRRDAARAYLTHPATFFLAEALFAQERYPEAEAAYREVLGAPADSAEYKRESEYGLVWCAARQARHADVIERATSYEREWGRDPAAAASVAELAFLRGEALLATGDAGAALEAYRVAGAGPHPDSAARGAAFALAAAGNHAGAAAAFESLLERFPESRHCGDAALQAGIEHLRAGDAARARRALEDARVEATPQAAYWVARAQRESGDPEAALATLERALAARPQGPLAEQLAGARGDALADLGRAEEAAEAYRSAGGEYGLYAAAVAALNAGRHEDALRSARRLLEQAPDSSYSAESLLVAGEAALALERFDEAEQHLSRLLALEGEQAAPVALRTRAASRAAWGRFLAGDPAAAAARFEALAAESPQAPEAEEALYMAGRARESLGENEAAAAAWSRWLERYPRSERRAEVLLGLARVEGGPAAMARLSEASRSANSGPLAEEALFRLGEEQARAGQRAQALRTHEQLLESYPEGEFARAARYALAWNHHAEGDMEAAQRALSPLLADRGATAELQQAARELAVWIAAAQGDAPASARAWDELAALCRDDARRMAALKVALGACRKSGDTQTGKGLIERFLQGVRDRKLATEALVEAAWLALDAEETDAAETAVRAALRVAPAEARAGTGGQALAEAVFFVGEARYKAGALERAAELYALAAPVAQGELAARVIYKQSFAALESGDLETAERGFAGLVAQHEDSALFGESLYLLGEARFRRGAWREAVAAFEQLIEKAPRHESASKALFRLGVARGELGEWEACATALSELLRRERDFPQQAEAQLWRGRALAARGDTRGARGALSAVVELDQGAWGAQARLALGDLARASGDLDAALSEYLKVAVLYAHAPSVAEALCRSGECLEAQGQTDAARARYREVIANHPDQPAAARARERLGAL